MTKESRHNLIFITVLLALTLPGGVMLFRKKLAQEAVRSNSLPDPVPRTVAYMSPAETPPGMRRVVPQRVAAWTDGLVRQFAGESAVRAPAVDGLPLMSRQRAFQVLALNRDREEIHVLVLLWDKGQTGPETRWSLAGESPRPLRVQWSERVPLPEPVRDELGVNGILVPPKSLLLQRLVLPAAEKLTVLTLVGENGTSDSVDIVPSFTSSAATADYKKKT
ncbi:MAG TPA: hypothetical protein VER17_08175 [Tepidisphaeraceae bacterium]|nr:hypothetical protein [Tepidisphaeraceae bacterium]